MLASSLKYKIEFFKPNQTKNNRDYSFDFAVMGAVSWKSGSLNVINDVLTYNQTVEVFIRKPNHHFTPDYHVHINGNEYSILCINNIDKDLKITVTK